MKTTTHECYVSFEVANLLKEAGFDWDCKGKFYDFTNALVIYKKPTLEVAQRWLREVKQIAIYVCPSWEPADMSKMDDSWVMKWQVDATYEEFDSNIIDLGDVTEICFNTYEDALETGIKRVLETILEKGE